MYDVPVAVVELLTKTKDGKKRCRRSVGEHGASLALASVWFAQRFRALYFLMSNAQVKLWKTHVRQTVVKQWHMHCTDPDPLQLPALSSTI